MRKLTRDQARRYALAAQGFPASPPSGRVDVRHFRRVIDRIGVLQLDSVNVLERAHYLPVFSRLGPYDRRALDRWTSKSGELFEYWGHMASLQPTAMYPNFRWRMEQHAAEAWQSLRRIREQRPGYIDGVLEQVRDRGPLAVGDLDDPGQRGTGMWNWQPGKHALEWLFASGRLAGYRNSNFGRLYDLPERVLPPRVLAISPPDEHEALELLLLDGARRLGVGTADDLVDYYRLSKPKAKKIVGRLANNGELVEVAVDGWKHAAFLHPEATLPRRAGGTALLSPFDSLVFHRDRVERLFDFFYRIEIYVPRPKREYGYYVLPFLLDGELVGRVDLKADRSGETLLVQASYIEDGHEPSRVAPAMAAELEQMAAWLGLSRVMVKRKGNLADALAKDVG
jgi:hypothetical protein